MLTSSGERMDRVVAELSLGAELHACTLLGRDLPALGADPVLDDRARAAYRRRLTDLDAQLDRADVTGDAAASSRLRGERDALVAELTAAAGLRGSPGGSATRPNAPARPSPRGCATRSRASPASTRTSVPTCAPRSPPASDAGTPRRSRRPGSSARRRRQTDRREA